MGLFICNCTYLRKENNVDEIRAHGPEYEVKIELRKCSEIFSIDMLACNSNQTRISLTIIHRSKVLSMP